MEGGSATSLGIFFLFPDRWTADLPLLEETLQSVSDLRGAAQIKHNIKGPEMKAPKVERCQASEHALHIPIFPIDRRATGSFADRPADERGSLK